MTNPYQSTKHVGPSRPLREPTPWLSVALLVVAGYYLASSLTLPLADKVWFGEIPVWALVALQIPGTSTDCSKRGTEPWPTKSISRSLD